MRHAKGRHNAMVGILEFEPIDAFREGRGAWVIEWSDGEVELTCGELDDISDELADMLERGEWTGSFRVRPATKADVDAVADLNYEDRREALREEWSDANPGRRRDDDTENMLDAHAAFGEWY